VQPGKTPPDDSSNRGLCDAERAQARSAFCLGCGGFVLPVWIAACPPQEIWQDGLGRRIKVAEEWVWNPLMGGVP